MSAAWIPFWSAVIVVIIGSIVPLLTLRGQRHKDRVDTIDKYDIIINRQADEIDELRQRITIIEQDRYLDRVYINSLERYIDDLVVAMRAGGIEPTTAKPVREQRQYSTKKDG